MGSIIRDRRFSSMSPFSFADVEKQALDILAKAESRAKRIVDESEGHIREVTEAHKREGYQAGWEQGRREGYEAAKHEAREQAIRDAEAELNQLTAALFEGLSEFEDRKRTLLAQAEAGLVDLAMAIARRVCKRLVERPGDVAAANARALLEMVDHHGDVELRVSPEEHELLNSEASSLMHEIAGLQHANVVADPSVPRGGSLLRTRYGRIDASVARQLDRIAEAICGSRAELEQDADGDAPAGDDGDRP
jgi:flagellar assembly protein FliH